MEFSNKLSLSLRQDIKALNEIASSILNKISAFELNSWLFPTKSFKDVAKITLRRKLGGNEYLGYLEIIVDRLYLIIHLFVKYIETHTSPLQKEQLVRNVVKSPSVSLGGSVHLLWKKLERLDVLANTQPFTKPTIGGQQNMPPTTNIGTQTAMYPSKACASCDVAMVCIKDIIKTLDTCGCNVSVEKMRKDLRDEIFDITQWGCMNRITTAITQDVESTAQKLKTLGDRNRMHSEKLHALTIKYGESLKIARSLEKSLKKSRKRSRNARSRNRELLKRVDELASANKAGEVKIGERDAMVDALQVSLRESRASLALLGSSNERLNKDLEQALAQNVSIFDEKNLWKRRFSDVYLEDRKLKARLEDMNRKIVSLRGAFDTLGGKSEEIAVLLERCNANVIKKSEGFEAFLHELKKQMHPSIEEAAHINTRQDSHPEFINEVTGDPLVDMRRQIAINQINIKNLQRQNSNLLRTIHRVEETILPIKSF